MSTDKETEEILNKFWDNVDNYEDFKSHNRRVQIEWTPKICWYLIPTIELNFSLKEIAINILCLGIYIQWSKKPF